MEHWIDARDEDNYRNRRLFVFHYDPRCINQRCWFIDPVSNEIVELLTDEHEDPEISIWEGRSIRKATRKRGKDGIEIDVVDEGLERSAEVEDDASAKNKAARKKQERKRDHRSGRSPRPNASPAPAAEDGDDQAIDQDDFEPIDLTQVRRGT